MLRPVATSVEIVDGFKLIITFDTGERRMLDIAPFMSGEWYGHLRDPDYFKLVVVNGYSVEWPEGQDIAPEDLYELSVPCEDE